MTKEERLKIISAGRDVITQIQLHGFSAVLDENEDPRAQLNIQRLSVALSEVLFFVEEDVVLEKTQLMSALRDSLTRAENLVNEWAVALSHLPTILEEVYCPDHDTKVRLLETIAANIPDSPAHHIVRNPGVFEI